MRRSKTGVVVAAAAAVISLVFASASATSTNAGEPIYFGMDAPLTGPTQLVGQSDRQTVGAVVKYWNARGGIKGRKVVVDVLDNASNPSQAVQNVQKFISDPKYVAIFGSGNAAAAVATGADREPGQDPVHRPLAADAARQSATAVRVHPHSHDPPVRVQRGPLPSDARRSRRSG